MTRVDKKKNQAKVVKEVLKNPLSTERDIAKSTGVGKSTVNRVKQELGQIGAKDDRIAGICQKDIENITKMQEVVANKIADKGEMETTRLSELAQVMREATARYSLFKGDVTDSQGGLKKLTQQETDLLNDVFKQNLG